ncbi:uncharacterized protein LOC131327003 [Rhododendron vialii]|uniref:uncharacterized protein LOC131327003 n=1 Tax=Rhododendron vialii TaxID=182163 RepID=UPI00265E4EFA|nr:uncharacterized protein LOC131327003 [Rhododendron vialii]
MLSRRRLNPPRAFHPFLLCFVLFLSWFPGSILSAVVTLDSIEIFKTHEWLAKPTVYFQCKGENKSVLPDVKEKHVAYTFKGEESWQPLTDFPNKKCKRCGFYEKDFFKSDEFDEWEFCPSDFTEPDGRYTHFTDKEFNATFLCSECVSHGIDSNHPSGSHNGGKGMHWVLILTLSILVSVVSIVGSVTAYKFWQKRQREKEQARFLKLFEEVDDIDDELGLGPLNGII